MEISLFHTPKASFGLGLLQSCITEPLLTIPLAHLVPLYVGHQCAPYLTPCYHQIIRTVSQ